MMEKTKEQIINNDSGDIDPVIMSLNRRLITSFQIILKLAAMHDIGNVALRDPLKSFCDAVDLLGQGNGETVLEVQGDNIFINEQKLRMDVELFSAYTTIVELFKARGTGSFSFGSGMTFEETGSFFRLFNRSVPDGADPVEYMSGYLQENNLPVSVLPVSSHIEDRSFKDVDSREAVKRTYAKTVIVVTEVMEGIKGKQVLNIRESKRVVQRLVDNLIRDESILIGLAMIKNYDEYTYNHSVHVCILALAIGQRLGYSKIRLGELGMAALFHDIGKSEIPIELLNKPSDFNEDEWNLIRKHPVHGVLKLIKLKGISNVSLKILSGTFEHHLNYDLSGYPVMRKNWHVSLFGKIISIADCYDALTDSRVYNRIPFTPFKALRFMTSKSGQAFDPVLIKVFVSMLGVYPVGSMVVLDDKSLAVVVKANPDPEFIARPQVRQVLPDNSMSDALIDLARHEVPGSFSHSILKDVDPYKYGINMAQVMDI